MQFSTAVWIILVIFGLFGAFMYSSIYFGLFTVGLFLIFYEHGTDGKKHQPIMHNTQYKSASTNVVTLTNICYNCKTVLDVDAAFCFQCGAEVRKR